MCKQLVRFGAAVATTLARPTAALLTLVLLLSAAPKATAASTNGYYGQLCLTNAFNYNSLAYNDAPIGTNGMMQKGADLTCLQCHAQLTNAPVGNSYAFEAYLFSYYAAQYAAAAYSADVNGNTAAAKTYYFYAYTYGAYAYTYGLQGYSGQFFNSAGATAEFNGYTYAKLGYMYCYFASQGM
jgi:hypothetical protein